MRNDDWERRQADLFFAELVGRRVHVRRRRRAQPMRESLPVEQVPDSTINPGRIFDEVVHRGIGPNVHFAEAEDDQDWDVLAMPRSSTPPDDLPRGSLVIERALGEGRLASMRVLGEDIQVAELYGEDGAVRSNVLVLGSGAAARSFQLPEIAETAWAEDDDGMTADSLLDDVPLDPAYQTDDDEPPPVWEQSYELRNLVKSPKTDTASRSVLERAAERQMRTTLLYEEVLKVVKTAQAGERLLILYVILFPGEGRDNTGMKDLNDKVLGYNLHSDFIRVRHERIRDIFKSPFTVVGQDYKTSLVLSNAPQEKGSADENRKMFDERLRKLDAALRDELMTLLPKAAANPKYKAEAEKLLGVLKGKPDYRFDIYYGTSVNPPPPARATARVGQVVTTGQDTLYTILVMLTEALKAAGLGRFIVKGASLKSKEAKQFVKKFKGDKKVDPRGKRFDQEIFLKASNRAEDIKRFMLIPPSNDNYNQDYNHIYIDTVWTLAFYVRQRKSNPDVVRDVRKKKLVRPTRPNQKMTFFAMKELLELWQVTVNILDFIKDFLLGELHSDLLQYHDEGIAVLQNVRRGQPIDQAKLESYVTKDLRQKQIAVIHTASEFQFFAAAADYQQRIFFSMDIRDLGVEVIQLYEESGQKIGDGKLKGRPLLEEAIRSTDTVVQRRRQTYQQVVQAFGRYYALLANSAKLRRTDGRLEAEKLFRCPVEGPATLPPFDEAVQIMLGGDEIFVAAHPKFAAYMHTIVEELDTTTYGSRGLNMRTCVALSKAKPGPKKRKDNQRAHARAMRLADESHSISKVLERTHRRIERLIDKLKENPKKEKDAPKYTERLKNLKLMKVFVRVFVMTQLAPRPFADVIARIRQGDCKDVELVDFSGNRVDCLKLLADAEALEKEVRDKVGRDNVRWEIPPVKGKKPKPWKPDKDKDKDKEEPRDRVDSDYDYDADEAAAADEAADAEDSDLSFLRWSPASRARYFPPRDKAAAGGRAFIETIKGEKTLPRPAPWLKRENAIVAELSAGNIPDALLRWTKVDLRYTDKTRSITGSIEVLPDYLAVGSNDDYVYVPLDPISAQLIADRFDTLLPTARMCHAIYQQAASKNRINSIERDYYQKDALKKSAKAGRDQDSTAAYLEHSDAIQARMKTLGLSLGDLVAGHKKDVVIAKRLHATPEKIAFHGFYDAKGYPHEPCYENKEGVPKPTCDKESPALAHTARFSDYSQGVRLVNPWMTVNGEQKKVSDVLADPDLSYLISSEGPIVPARIPRTVKPKLGPV